MKNIIRWQLWQRRWFVFWWCIAIVAFIALNLAFYPSFKDQAAQLEQSLGQLPDAAMAFLSDTGDFFSPAGYLSSQIFYLVLPMLLSIVTIVLGSSLIAKEERDGTIELLLSRPISRQKLLIIKTLSGLSILGIIGTVCLVAIVTICAMVDISIPLKNIALTTLVTCLFAFTVGAIAFTLTAIGRFGRAASVGIATGIALGGYIISSLITVADWLEFPARLFPFYYYKPAAILNGVYQFGDLLYYFFVIIACIIISSVFFGRRDIGN